MFDNIENSEQYLEAIANYKSEAVDFANGCKRALAHIQQQYEWWQEAGVINDRDKEILNEKLDDLSTYIADTVRDILNKPRDEDEL